MYIACTYVVIQKIMYTIWCGKTIGIDIARNNDCVHGNYIFRMRAVQRKRKTEN